MESDAAESQRSGMTNFASQRVSSSHTGFYINILGSIMWHLGTWTLTVTTEAQDADGSMAVKAKRCLVERMYLGDGLPTSLEF